MNDNRLKKSADVAKSDVFNVIDDLVSAIGELECDNHELKENLETAELKLEETEALVIELQETIEDLQRQLRDGSYAIY